MSYIAFIAPGLVCVAAMNGASFEVTYNIYVRMNFEKSYDAMLTTPIEPQDVLAGEVLWAMTRACIYGGSFFIVIVLFGLAPLPSALAAVPVIPLTGLLFAAIGMAFTLRLTNIDLFSFYFTLFLTPLFLFSDIFFPLEGAPVRRVAVGRRGAAAAASGAPRAPGVSRRVRARWCCGTWRICWCVSALLLAWAGRTVRRRLTN